MKIDLEELIRSVSHESVPVSELAPERQERIRRMTMMKIENTGAAEKRRRPAVAVVAVAAAVTMLSVTAFAAYESGWFGRIFGEKAGLVEEHVVSYDPSTEEFGAADVTQPFYTEEEQAMIDEATMFVPEQAELAEEGVSASTADYTFTLEEMLSSEDTLLAILRIEAQNEDAESELSQIGESEDDDGFFVHALNYAGEGHEREAKNGSLSCDVLSVEGSGAFLLVRNVGGQFVMGDPILFQYVSVDAGAVDLFEVPLEQVMEPVTIALDVSNYEGLDYQWDSISMTPISLITYGTVLGSADYSDPDITIVLADGATIHLPTWKEEYQSNDYAAFGGGAAGFADDPWMNRAWYFKQAVDLSEIDHITVDGVDYTLDN